MAEVTRGTAGEATGEGAAASSSSAKPSTAATASASMASAGAPVGSAAVGAQTEQQTTPTQPTKKKRGRPKGSVDAKPRKKVAAKRPGVEIQYQSEADKRRFMAAQMVIQAKVKCVEAAQTDIMRCEEELRRVQARLEAAKKRSVQAQEAFQIMSSRKANDLLLEPTEWNQRYTNLLKYRNDKGEVEHLTQKKLDQIPKGEERNMYRRLMKWASAQRTAKREGKLHPYQEILLDRIKFTWKAPQGPQKGQGGKWFGHYTALREFKRLHGHFDVLKDYAPDPQLKEWFKTQIYLYHAKEEGKMLLGGLTDDRQRLLEEIGVEWPPKRVATPWEARFNELLLYKREHGHW